MRKLFLPAFLALFIISGLTSSCTKEVTKVVRDTTVIRDTLTIRDTIVKTPVYPIEGLWIGTYTVDGLTGQGELFYSMTIYSDGRILTKSKGGDGKDHFCSGTWILSNGVNFFATIVTFSPNSGPTAITQSITATFSNTGRLTNGIWMDTVSPYPKNKGKFSIFQRVN